MSEFMSDREYMGEREYMGDKECTCKPGDPCWFHRANGFSPIERPQTNKCDPVQKDANEVGGYHPIEAVNRRIRECLMQNSALPFPEHESANNQQVGGSHYSSRSIQPWDYIAANKLDFFQGSIIKYVTRCWDKNGLEDLKKARHFLDKYIEIHETDPVLDLYKDEREFIQGPSTNK